MQESWDERNLIFDKSANDNHTRAAHQTFNRKEWPGFCHARPHRTSGGSLQEPREGQRERETETALVAGTSTDHFTSVRDGDPRPEPQGALLGHPVPSLSPSTPVPRRQCQTVLETVTPSRHRHRGLTPQPPPTTSRSPEPRGRERTRAAKPDGSAVPPLPAPPRPSPPPGRCGQALTSHLDMLGDLDELHLRGHVAQCPHALAQVPVADVAIAVRVKLLEGSLKLCRGGRSGAGSQALGHLPPAAASKGHSPSSSSGPSSRSCRGIVRHVPGAGQGSGRTSSSSPSPHWPGQGPSHKGRRRQLKSRGPQEKR